MITDTKYLEIIISIEIHFYYRGFKMTHYSDNGNILDEIKIDY